MNTDGRFRMSVGVRRIMHSLVRQRKLISFGEPESIKENIE